MRTFAVIKKGKRIDAPSLEWALAIQAASGGRVVNVETFDAPRPSGAFTRGLGDLSERMPPKRKWPRKRKPDYMKPGACKVIFSR
jgi:hypothetical protein